MGYAPGKLCDLRRNPCGKDGFLTATKRNQGGSLGAAPSARHNCRITNQKKPAIRRGGIFHLWPEDAAPMEIWPLSFVGLRRCQPDGLREAKTDIMACIVRKIGNIGYILLPQHFSWQHKRQHTSNMLHLLHGEPSHTEPEGGLGLIFSDPLDGASCDT